MWLTALHGLTSDTHLAHLTFHYAGCVISLSCWFFRCGLSVCSSSNKLSKGFAEVIFEWKRWKETSWPWVFTMTTIISARSHKGKWCHDMTWVWTGTTKWKLISVFEGKRWLLGFRWDKAGLLSSDILPVPAVRAWQGSMFAWWRSDLPPLQHDMMNRTGYSSMSVYTVLVSRLSGPAVHRVISKQCMHFF